MGFVLGRLIAVAAVVAGSLGCARRDRAVIGVAFGADDGVLAMVRAELDRRFGMQAPQIHSATGMVTESGAPGQVTVATRLTAIPGIGGVVGHADSRGTLVAAPVYNEKHIPLLVPTATSRRLRDSGPWVFTLAPDDSLEAEFIAQFAVRSLGARAIAVFYDNDEYGIGLRDALRDALTAGGGSARISTEQPIASPCGAPESAEASIVHATPPGRAPDLVIIAGRTLDAACIARRVSARAAGIRVIGGDAVEPDSAFYSALAPATPQFYVVAFWHPRAPGAASASFAQDFERITGKPANPSQALQFDAAMLLAQAVHEVGSHPDEVRRYLTELGAGRPPYDGVTGPVAFGSGFRRPLYMLRVTRGSAPAVVP